MPMRRKTCTTRTIATPRSIRVAVLAAVVGLVVPYGSTTAHSSPPVAEISYFLHVRKPARVCAGSQLKLAASLQREISQPLPWGGMMNAMDSVGVTAKVADPGVLGPAESLEVTGWDQSSPPEAVFTFAAKKPGLTTITFDADIAHMSEVAGEVHWPGVLTVAPVTREVRVVNCHYKVLVASTWDFPESQLTLTSIFLGAELRFNGDELAAGASATAAVTWGTNKRVSGPCSFTQTIDPSTASLSGEIDESGIVRIKVTWSSSTAHNVSSCPSAGSSAPVTPTPDPITIEMAPGASVKNWSATQTLGFLGRSQAGWADYEIFVVTDEK